MTTANHSDLLILGSGPAGLSAAIYGSTEGLRVHVLERTDKLGGQISRSAALENLAGFPNGISGPAFINRSYRQAKRLGATFNDSTLVDRIDREKGRFLAYSGSKLIADASALMLATGMKFNHIPTIPEFPGVYYGHALHTPVAGKEVIVVGGGNSAGQAIIYLARFAKRVSVVVRERHLGASMSEYLIHRIQALPNVDLLLGTSVVSVETGKGKRVRGVCLNNNVCYPASGVYVFAGMKPNSEPFPELERTSEGFYVTNPSAETSIPGVFVGGDVRAGGIKRVSSALADGAIAVHGVYTYLQCVNGGPENPCRRLKREMK